MASFHHEGMELDGQPVAMNDVYAEVQGIMTKAGIKKFMARPSTKKYCFEKADIPAEAEYLYPPLTFLRPTKNQVDITIRRGTGNKAAPSALWSWCGGRGHEDGDDEDVVPELPVEAVTFTVVELEPLR